MEDKIKDDQKANWKKARTGLIIFAVIHLFFEVIMSDAMGQDSSRVGLPIIVNFLISRWIIKSQLSKGKEFQNMILMSLIVSSGVFAVRLILGTLILSSF
tara:strand:- start:625 stop:924 length:300 start_codon:yes stop_codon:yes gene_type:complete